MRGKSALELLEACVTHPHWLFRGRCFGVPYRTLGAENVSTVSAVVLEEEEGEERYEAQLKKEANIFSFSFLKRQKKTSYVPS